MRARLLTALLSIALVLTLAASVRAAEESNAMLASVSIQGRIEYGYALVFIEVKFPNPVSSFSLNISGFEDKVLLAVAKADGQQARGQVSGHFLIFRAAREFTRANVTLVIDAVFVNATTFSVALPVPLAPLGVVANVTGSFTLGTSFTAETLIGNFSQGVVRYNLTTVPGACDVIRAQAPLSTVGMAKITFLNRTILITPDKVEYLDTLHLTLEGGSPVTTLRLTLPSTFKLDAVKASLFTYPLRYISQYSAGNNTLVVINLLPALQDWGQRSIITLHYSSPFNGTVNAYMGLGPLIRNYTLRVCIEGTATLSPSAHAVEKVSPSMHCYLLTAEGALLQPDMYPPIAVTPSFTQTTRSPLPLLGVAALIAVVGAAGYLALRQEKPKEQQIFEKIAEPGSTERIRELIESRRNNLLALTRQLREYRARGMGITKVISLVNSHMRRDSTLSLELRTLLTSLGSQGEKAFSALTTIDNELNRYLEALLETERMFRRGKLTKQEYRDKVSEIEDKILELAQKLERINRQLTL